MRKITTIIASISLGLTATPIVSGCTPGGIISTPGTFDPSAPIAIPLKVKEAYRTALQASIGIETSVNLAIDAGLLKPGTPEAIKVADILHTIKGVVDAIHTAYRAGNTSDLATRIAELTSLVTQVSVLISSAD